MRKWKSAFVFAAAVAGLILSIAAQSQQPASKPATKAGASLVHSIVLPQYPPKIPQGPNVEIYSKNCLL